MRKLAILLCLFISVTAFAADNVWHPEKTWLFAVGVLNFDTKGLATWPDEGRQDAVMIEAYKKRGVPADHIVFIKNADATKANLVSSFNEMLAKTGADDTLIFYYAGHGGRDYNDPKRPSWFVSYDTKKSWPMAEVFDTIEKRFKGVNVLMTSDCCHSGALANEAAKRTGRINFGVLASSNATSRSTGNWTFTQCLTEMLNGNPMLDRNGDGKITFSESAQYFEDVMAFWEGQLSCSACKGQFSPDLIMATTSGTKHEHAGEFCEGFDDKKWYKVKILDSKPGQVYVTWLGWDKKWDRWIDVKNTRPFVSKTFKSGEVVEIEYDKTWYPGKIKGNKLGLQFVHYDGFPDADDEWVTPDRIRVK